MSRCSNSELRASDSQDLGPLDSFSLPSEPPDIANWYSSYVYESPELNTLDGFQDLDGSGENFVEEPVGKLDDALVDAPKKPSSDDRRSNESDEFILGKSSSLVTGSLESLSSFSEPPDIKQWFSSYVYESPTLDTALEFAISESEDDKLCNVQTNCRQDKKDVVAFVGAEENRELCSQHRDPSVFIKCTDSVEDPKFDYQSVSKVTGSSESLSFSSEPPDIKKWFSSYVYESPTLDTALDFAFSDYKESEDGKLFNVQVNCRQDKKDAVAFVGAAENIVLYSQHSDPNVFIKCTNSLKDSKSDYQSVSKDIHNVAPPKPIPSTVRQLNGDKVSDSSLSERQSNSHDEDDDGNLHVNSADERSAISLNVEKYTGSLDGESVHISDLTIPEGDSNGWGSQRSCHGKENNENKLRENGFISIRKKGCQVNAGNVIRRVRVDGVELKRNREKDAEIVRKVLSEISNFSSKDSTGKWQCPQKNKPELGPPLKQLRLDQWFNRR